MSGTNEQDLARQREQPSTYFVQDRSNLDELKRIQLQDQIVTAGMGGVLPEQENLEHFKRILDVGCGGGGWLVATAQALPHASLLIGVDANSKMVAMARALAEAQEVADHIEFHVMDALRMLEFPTAFFDLVNQRSAVSWVRTWDWTKLLGEYRRIIRPNGIVRITEPEMCSESPSAALDRLFDLLLAAFSQAGHLFTSRSDGVTSRLVELLTQAGFSHIQTRFSDLEYRMDTPEGQLACEGVRYLFRTIIPFLRKWTRVPEDYDDIYQQAVNDMQQPDFVITSRMLTVWGTNSEML
jgi:ubiquinone/menaquinone biosynthesis C-methylase UbiE